MLTDVRSSTFLFIYVSYVCTVRVLCVYITCVHRYRRPINLNVYQFVPLPVVEINVQRREEYRYWRYLY